MLKPKNEASLLKNVSGLDAAEIRIEQSINEMVSVLRRTHSEKKKVYLLNEINYRKRKLNIIREGKSNLH